MQGQGSDPVAAAAAALAAARLGRVRFARLDDWCAPADTDAGYDVQAALNRLLTDAGHGAVVGTKIGCTTRVMQEYMGIDSPCAGAIFAPTVHRGDAVVPFRELVGPGVECELAVRLAEPLDGAGPFSRADVAAAIGSCCVAIELVEDRFVDFRSLPTPTLIADDFFGAGCVLGPERTDVDPLELDRIAASLAIGGEPVGEGRGSDILGHPLEALVWLAGHAAGRGRPLRAGEIVMLGSVVRTAWLEPGDIVRVASPQLGEASLAVP